MTAAAADSVENESGISVAASDPKMEGGHREEEEGGGKGVVSSRQDPKPRPKLGSRRTSFYADLTHVPGVKIRLFSPPRQRQKWGSDQILPHVNWGDLFFDLFYVAGFYNLGNILLDDPSPEGVLYFLGCFFPLMSIWMTKEHYDCRFTYGDDIFHKIFDTAFLVVLATAVSYVATVPRMSNPSDHFEMFGFALSLSLASLLSILRYVECYFYGRGQRSNIVAVSKGDIKHLSISLVFSVAAMVVAGIAYFGNENEFDDAHRKLAGGAGSEADCDNINKTHSPIVLVLLGFAATLLYSIIRVIFLFPKNGEHKKITIPMNVEFVIHRQGEWTMLVLGESVLSLLIVDAEHSESILAFYFGIVTVIMLQLLHFRSQPHDPDAHALRRDKNAGVLYIVAFHCYSAALLAVGASYKLFLYVLADGAQRRLASFPVDDEDHHLYRWLAGGGGDTGCGPSYDERKKMVAHLFCGAMAIVFFCLDSLVLTHVGLKREVDKCKVYGVACKKTGITKIHYNFKGILFVVFPRGAITIFIATLSTWQDDPKTLAQLGFAAVVGQLITRILGNFFFPYHGNHNAHGHHDQGVMDDDEDCDDESLKEDEV